MIPNPTSTSVYARILLDELHVDVAVASLPRYTLKAFGQVLLPLTISSIQTNGLSLVKPFLHLVLIDFCDRYPHPPLPAAMSPIWCPRKGAPLHSLDHLDPTLRSWIDLPCVLCGQGDNSVQHWLRFCPVPALVGSALLNRPLAYV